ncbi:MAG: hypothetical protein CSA38_00725 [Flavobacteriales bacterium]|nr:MAG: hypothetical protein CSA38_00725 [Flavobacteriales bacterium]
MKNRILSLGIIALSIFTTLTACRKDDGITTGTTTGTTTDTTTGTTTGADPNFSIVANNDPGFSSFTKKVVVFGIDIYAASGVEDAKLLHAANVMAQYLDNNEDGTIDNQLVLDKMIENKAFLMIWKNQSDMNINPPSGRVGQDLGNDETNPSFVANGLTGQFDASLEEVLHLVNNAGHSYAYPTVFGQNEGSQVANAMDIARGGKFLTIPSSYPANAWYTYSDQTCAYGDCQIIEYMYWSLTSILGAQTNRLSEIQNEWKLNTKTKVQNTDPTIYAIMTNPTYKMPTVLPDGTYKH